MPNYRRWYVPGGTYFFTVVTHERRPILTSSKGRLCLRLALEAEQKVRPFESVAMVLLPNHLHAIWTLPEGDSNYSGRWASIKEEFTRQFRARGGTEGTITESRIRHRERAIWQRRFWEHVCTSKDDFKRFLDYIHWNPVKHGLVRSVSDWKWSTFVKFVRLGEYEANWGSIDPCPNFEEPEWK